jgi:D-alanyl-D-alanine carboxypeptidase
MSVRAEERLLQAIHRFAGFIVACVLIGTLAAPAAARTSSSIVVDAASGKILYESNADARAYPASLTKMMTLYLTFEALGRGKLRRDASLPISRHAAGMSETNIDLRPGDTLTVDQAIRAVVVRSANDAAVVLAEALASSESRFAEIMTGKARALGMTNTTFRNASGLPDNRQRTTARDLAILAQALVRDYAKYYGYFSVTKFPYRGRTYVTHNRFMQRYKGADGLKTGYIRASGFNLAGSAVREGRRLIAIVLGGKSAGSRDAEMMRLLDKGFKLARSLPTLEMASLASPPAAAREVAIPPQKPAIAALVASIETVPEAGETVPEAGGLEAGLPVPRLKPSATTEIALAATSAPSHAPFPVATATPSAAASTTYSLAGLPVPAAKPTLLADDSTVPPVKPVQVAASENEELSLALISVAVAADSSELLASSGRWAVQVGAYSQFKPAHEAALRATRMMPALLDHGRIVIDERAKDDLYRARIAGLTRAEAQAACKQLKAKKIACLALASDTTIAMTAN